MNSTHQTPARSRLPKEGRPTHSEDGADLTLIRWFLTLTPAERLEALQEAVRSHVEFREIFKKSNPGQPFPKCVSSIYIHRVLPHQTWISLDYS